MMQLYTPLVLNTMVFCVQICQVMGHKTFVQRQCLQKNYSMIKLYGQQKYEVMLQYREKRADTYQLKKDPLQLTFPEAKQV